MLSLSSSSLCQLVFSYRGFIVLSEYFPTTDHSDEQCKKKKKEKKKYDYCCFHEACICVYPTLKSVRDTKSSFRVQSARKAFDRTNGYIKLAID